MNTILKLIFATVILFAVNSSTNAQSWCTCGNCGGGGWIEENLTCNGCNGAGGLTCALCGGSGNESCPACSGSGTVTDSDGAEVECPNCQGGKTVVCGACDGEGSAVCLRCGGTGRIDEQMPCPVCERTGLVECPE